MRDASEASLYRPSALARRAAYVAPEAPAVSVHRPSTSLIIAGLAAALLALELALWAWPVRRESSWRASLTCSQDSDPSCQVTTSVSASAWRQRDRTQPIRFSDGASPIVELRPVCQLGRLAYLVPVQEGVVKSATGQVTLILRPTPVFVVTSPAHDGQGADTTCCEPDELGCDGDDGRSSRK